MFYLSLVVIALVFIWRMVAGYKKGLVQEIISIIVMIAGGFCMVLLLGAISNYLNREIGQLVRTIAVLATVCLVYRFVSIFLTSMKLVSKLPVIRGADKLLGIVLGMLEAGAITVLAVHFIKEWGLQFISLPI